MTEKSSKSVSKRQFLAGLIVDVQNPEKIV
jgi:hypothetical protein